MLSAVGHLLPAVEVSRNGITMHLIEFLILTALIFTAELDAGHPRWHIRPAFLSALFAAMLTAGISTERAETIAAFRDRVQQTLESMAAAERTLSPADVVMDAAPTNTWWDTASPRRLRAGDTDNSVFAQMRMLVTGHWKEGSHTDAPFAVALDLLVPTEYATRTPQVQCTGVVAHLQQTALRQELIFYVLPDEADGEMGRRAAKTDELSFEPLFKRIWKSAYPELMDMLPAYSNSTAVILTVKGLLARLNLSTTFTDASVTSFCKVIKPHLPNLHGLKTAADQDARIEQLLASVGTDNLRGSTRNTADGKAEKDSEQWTKVYRQKEFQDLQRVLESLQTLPLDNRRIVAEMFKAPSAAGWMQLNGTMVPQAFFRAVSGLSANKGIAAIHDCVNNALSRTTDGALIINAGALISEKVAKNTVAGNIANGSGKNETDWWTEIIQPVVAKRDGLDALNGVFTSSADDFFIDVRKLELSVEILRDWFAMFGFDDNGVGSATTIIRNIIRQAKVLMHMRDTESRKPGLTQNFKDAANGIFKEFAATIRAMLAGPVSAAVRPTRVLASGTPAASAWTAAVDDIKKIVDEHKLEDAGVGRKQKYLRTDDGASGTPARSVISLAKSSPLGGRGSGASTILPDDSVSSAGKKLEEGVSPGWGDFAAKFGVTFNGDSLVFGHNAVQFEEDIEVDLTGCLGKYAPEPESWKRDSWCTMPHICRTSNRHKRPAGLDDDKVTSTKVPDGKVDPNWQVLRPRVAPVQKGKGRGKGGEKGKGRGGKGRGFGR